MKTLIIFPLVLLLSSCYLFKDGAKPLETISYPQQNPSIKNTNIKKLMVLLPGIGDTASAFNQHNFIGDVHKVAPDIDIVSVDAHFKYYQNRTIINRLRIDVIQPARAAGYREIYLGGISLGGFGALLYLKQYPNEINKIFILAPYLGEKEDFEYLLTNEKTPKILRSETLWPWLTRLSPRIKNKIYLAYGSSDKFAEQNGLLADQLPTSNVVVQEGEHFWETWEKLWPELLIKLKSNSTAGVIMR